MKKFIKNAVVLTAAVMLALGLSTTAFASGIGNVTTLSDSEIASKVQYTTMKAVSGSKTRNINQISFSSKDSDYMLLPYFGDNLLSRHTLTEMAENAEKEGYEVVGGVNGDFFYVEGDEPTGMPRGPMIQNDRIICTEDFPPNINAMSAEDW